MKKHDIISGDFGQGFRRMDISQFLTVHGMDVLWWNVLRDSAVKMTGNVRIMKLMSLKKNCMTGAL